MQMKKTPLKSRLPGFGKRSFKENRSMESDEPPPTALASDPTGGTSVVIRQMTIDDIPVIYHLGDKLFTARMAPNAHRTWDEYEVVGFYQTDCEFCFVAEDENAAVIGFALGTVIEKHHSWTYGYLIWLGVHPDYQKLGIAQRLFRQLKSAMIDAGARIIMVDTDADNTASLKFFNKMGFNHTRRHVYLTMNVDDDRRRLEDRRKDRTTRYTVDEQDGD
jgi:ribosomal protein S18 acetylase RimI-like enzyme